MSTVPAPDLPYRPTDPVRYRPNIGLIGCGGITRSHLQAYVKAGYSVVALCDVNPAAARERQQEFYPKAQIYTDHRELLARQDIQVVDIATHPAVRVRLIEDALLAGKHVLSQKPFVLDLAVGAKLAALAEHQGVLLAVNQNGRWAPHFSYLRRAVQAGYIGEVTSIQMAVNWDHNWVQGTEFEKIHHVILYDFAIHWFDMVACLMGQAEAQWVSAAVAHSPSQRAIPPLLAAAQIRYPSALVSLTFNADTRFGRRDSTTIVGTQGTLHSSGPSLSRQSVTLTTAAGESHPELQGSWFPDGFHGTMGELLCAIEEGRQPETQARDNLRGLALCFAAMHGADGGTPVRPGEVDGVPG